MKLVLFTILDRASAAYMRPFSFLSVGQAERSFRDLCNDKDHEVGRHPEDYTLVRCGQFDDNTGQLLPENVETILSGRDIVAAQAAEGVGRFINPEVNGEDPASVLTPVAD